MSYNNGVREMTVWLDATLKWATAKHDEPVEVHTDYIKGRIVLKALEPDEKDAVEYVLTVRRRGRAEGVQQEDD